MPSIGLLVLIPRPAAQPLVGVDRCYVHLDPRSGHPIPDESFIPKDEDTLCADTVAAAAFGSSVADLGLDGIRVDALTAAVSTANVPARFARAGLTKLRACSAPPSTRRCSSARALRRTSSGPSRCCLIAS